MSRDRDRPSVRGFGLLTQSPLEGPSPTSPGQVAPVDRSALGPDPALASWANFWLTIGETPLRSIDGCYDDESHEDNPQYIHPPGNMLSLNARPDLEGRNPSGWLIPKISSPSRGLWSLSTAASMRPRSCSGPSSRWSPPSSTCLRAPTTTRSRYACRSRTAGSMKEQSVLTFGTGRWSRSETRLPSGQGNPPCRNIRLASTRL